MKVEECVIMTGINNDLLGKMYLFVLCDINLDLDIFIDFRAIEDPNYWRGNW